MPGQISVAGAYMQQEAEHTNLRISDHANVGKAVVIEHAGHVSLSGPELQQRRRPLQVPRDIPEFTGREEIFGKISVSLASHLETPAIWILSGMAGVGKTSIAIRAANRHSDRFPDGILYAKLAGAGSNPTDPNEVLVRFLKDLGVALGEIPGDYESLVTAYRTLIATKAILVVLDDAANTAQVNDLIPTSPRSAALITSRRPLVTLPGAQSISVDVWTLDECTQFLKVLLGANHIADSTDEVHELSEICGRLPLALRIIGAQLLRRPLWPLARMVNRLRDEQRRLEVLRADDIAIRSVFTTAYESLTDVQSRIFHTVGLTLGSSFSVESVARLCDADEHFVEDALEDLADRHLISPDDIPGRFKIHDLMRIFAKERAVDQDSSAAVSESVHRLLQWHLEVLEGMSPSIRKWVRLERPSLVAGVLLANEHHWDDLCWRTANHLASFHSVERDYGEWILCNEAGLVAARRCGAREGEALMLGGLGQASRRLNRFNDAQSYLEDSLKVFREMKDLERCADVLWEIGKTASSQWDVGRAMSAYSESVEIYAAIGYLPGQARALHALGHLYSGIGRHDEALKYFKEELELATKASSNSNTLSTTYQGMASCLAAGGMLEESIEAYEKSISEAQVANDQKALQIRLARKAGVLQSMGKADEASATYEDALKLAREQDDTSGIAWILHTLADKHEKAKEYEEADSLYAEILNTDGIDEVPEGLINTLHCWADSFMRRENFDRSIELLDKAQDIARQHDRVPELIQVLLCRSAALQKNGDIDEALSLAREAAAIATSYGSAKYLAQCLRRVGMSLRGLTRIEDAAEVYAEKMRLEILMQRHEKANETAKELSSIWAELDDTDRAEFYSARASEFAREAERITSENRKPLEIH
ncbi:tetratricopeptide repeat protein [Streptomyces sp. NPDC088555]|uniref:tetratricopeptide repeat protein n=1 Tax=Streptomyces sp. NPDC088555 TaxID=3365866 RepID=UPI003808B103